MLASEVPATLLEITAVTLSLPLLYGMMLRFFTPASFSISATKCGVLAVPAVAPFTPLSPWVFAPGTKFFMFLAGVLGCTTITQGATANLATATRAPSGEGKVFPDLLVVHI